MLNASELQKRGEGFVRARPDDETRYGAPALVSALAEAALVVARTHPGGHPLKIGDLSLPQGGRHARHGSHRTGRDADVLFFLNDTEGAPIAASGFFAFDERPAATHQGTLVFFDTARNWALVSALLSGPSLVQWIFCADGIKARLLAFGALHEPDPEVLLRAAYVLHQPTYGNPHRDHFHVRVACSAEERATGCVDDGPSWPWLRNEHEKATWSAGGNDDATLLGHLMAEDHGPR